MNVARLLSRPVSCAALPLRAAAQPSCRSSAHDHRRSSAQGAGKTEGKIEGDGTASRRAPDLHKLGHGTRRRLQRAASMPTWAALLVKRRAVCASIPPTATGWPG